MSNKPLQIGTLFSGIGAAEFALKRLGIEHNIVFACDNGERPLTQSDEIIRTELKGLTDPKERKEYIRTLTPKHTNFVKETYLANYKIEESQFYHDVRYMEAEEYKGRIDLLVGGSPCQSFTLLGYQKGLEEARGTLFYEFARIVKECQPKAFIYENVQGLTTHDKGRTWGVVQRVFQSLNYSIHYKIIDAVTQGIPQRRRRIFVVGFRDKVDNFAFPCEIPLKFTLQDFLLDNAKYGNFSSEDGKIVIKKGGEPIDEKYFLSEKILPGIMSSGTGGFFMAPEIDLTIARPLMSSMHKMHRAGEDNYVTTNGRIRKLTPRECLRLMGFTDDFRQVVSDTQMYRQAGNSIVVDIFVRLLPNIIQIIGE